MRTCKLEMETGIIEGNIGTNNFQNLGVNHGMIDGHGFLLGSIRGIRLNYRRDTYVLPSWSLGFRV